MIIEKYKLPILGYEYDALEPYIDTKTMEIHYSKHHQAYVDKLNIVLANFTELQKKSVEELLKNLDKVPEKIRQVIGNYGGGHWNHSFFWSILKKEVQPKNEILDVINKRFGSFEKFKDEFTNAAVTLFGSGWAWLVLNNGKLEIIQTMNQDSPISQGKIPLLCIDVWEHAYYLKYQNRRAEYVQAFFNVINWDKVEEIFKTEKRRK